MLEERLKNYIFTVGERYRNDICSVDVVNECISDKNFVLRDGADRSQWFDILGPEYVDKAFFWAKEAFPKSSLVINDYNLEMVPGKREGMYKLLKGMLEHGVPVDTVGLQMHINIEYPPVSEIEKTIELYGSLGLKVIVTEMEISMYADREQDKGIFEERKEYTAELLEKQAKRYEEIFECFKKEAKAGILAVNRVIQTNRLHDAFYMNLMGGGILQAMKQNLVVVVCLWQGEDAGLGFRSPENGKTKVSEFRIHNLYLLILLVYLDLQLIMEVAVFVAESAHADVGGVDVRNNRFQFL